MHHFLGLSNIIFWHINRPSPVAQGPSILMFGVLDFSGVFSHDCWYRKKHFRNLSTMGIHVSFIFRGFNPIFLGLETLMLSWFWGPKQRLVFLFNHLNFYLNPWGESSNFTNIFSKRLKSPTSQHVCQENSPCVDSYYLLFQWRSSSLLCFKRKLQGVMVIPKKNPFFFEMQNPSP